MIHNRFHHPRSHVPFNYIAVYFLLVFPEGAELLDLVGSATCKLLDVSGIVLTSSRFRGGNGGTGDVSLGGGLLGE